MNVTERPADESMLVEAERRLLTRSFQDRAELEVLLEDNVVEFGRSGNVYDKAQILSALNGTEGSDVWMAELAGVVTRLLTTDVVLLTYVSF